MGNFVYEASLKVTNSGMIGKAKIDEKFVLWFKQNNYLNEIIFLHQLFVMQKHSEVFNSYSSLPIYDSIQPFENQTYYLLPKQEGDFLIDIIWNNNKLKIHFEETQIKHYLKQLLEALYQLHKLEIPGRVFSVYNIFETKEHKIILYDFGFAPKIEQDELQILSPPEYFLNLNKLQQNQSNVDDKFDLKFDIWLIGGFLYHLIKGLPICEQRKGNTKESMMYKYKYLEQYLQTNYKKTISQENIKYFSKDLIDFVNSLINVDVEKRKSFFELYQTEYIKLLGVINYNEKIYFYKDKEHLSLKKFFFNNLISTVSSQDNNSEFSSASETNKMRSFICPGFQEIIKFKADPENEEIVFYCQIFSLKMHILKILYDFILQNKQAQGLADLVQRLQFQHYYQALTQIQFFSSQISFIFSKAKKYGNNSSTELQLQCLYQIQNYVQSFQNIWNQPIQLDLQKLGINQLSYLNVNQQLIIMCCLNLETFFQKSQIEEYIRINNLQFKLIEFPCVFYELLQNGEEFKQKIILDYLQQKFPIRK